MTRGQVTGLVFVAGVVALVVGGAGALAFWGLVLGAWERPTPVQVTDWSRIGPELDAIHVRGMAHYGGRAVLQDPGTLVREPQTWYVYGLFEPHDVDSREIRVLVRTTVKPEDMVSFEYLELEGWLYEPTKYTVPFYVEELFQQQSDYYFHPEMLVLQPWSQEAYEP